MNPLRQQPQQRPQSQSSSTYAPSINSTTSSNGSVNTRNSNSSNYYKQPIRGTIGVSSDANALDARDAYGCRKDDFKCKANANRAIVATRR